MNVEQAKTALLSVDEVEYIALLVTIDMKNCRNLLLETQPDQFEGMRDDATKKLRLALSILEKIKPPN
jgi:hypothetical protein